MNERKKEGKKEVTEKQIVRGLESFRNFSPFQHCFNALPHLRTVSLNKFTVERGIK